MNEKVRPFSGDISELKVTLAGITYPDPKYRIERKPSDVTVVEYVRSGTGHIIFDGKPVEIEAGKVYLLCKGENHEYYSSADNPWEKVFINVSGKLAKTLPMDLGLSVMNVFDGEEFAEIFADVEKIVEKTPEKSDNTEITVLFFKILLALSQKNKNLNYTSEAVKLKNYLDDNINRIVWNKELANLIYRSKDYCIKLFFKEFGITPYEYQLDLKMKYVCTLLENTAIPISVIAETVGYNDPQYFSGLFKRKVGIPPSVYRKDRRKCEINS